MDSHGSSEKNSSVKDSGPFIGRTYAFAPRKGNSSVSTTFQVCFEISPDLVFQLRRHDRVQVIAIHTHCVHVVVPTRKVLLKYESARRSYRITRQVWDFN